MAKISVCIPTYNRAQLLPVAIASVLQQTESDWQLIICDDGSTDDTPVVMANYQDERIHYLRHPQNVGKSNNMRSGFTAATGDYFIKFDDDDRLTPEFLAQTSRILDGHPAIDFVGTDHWVIDQDGERNAHITQLNSQKWGRTELATGVVHNLLEVTFIKQSFQIGATLFRRHVLETVGYMRPNMQNCEDNDLLVRLALAGKQAYYLPERLMEYRFHAEQHGIQREIPYLQDQLAYLENFHFAAESLEKVRRSRIAAAQLSLGFRLMQMGDISQGRELVIAGRNASPTKAIGSMAFSFLPTNVRQQALGLMRRGSGR
jgi:glycosyltransferase involved in cell wall biosynthesis